MGVVVSLVLYDTVDPGTVLAFALAGALVGASIGGLIAAAPMALASGAGVASKMAAMAFLGSLVGAVGGGIFYGATYGPRAIVYGIVLGWSIGALSGIANTGGAAIFDAGLSFWSLAGATTAGALGFNGISALGNNILEVLKGDRKLKDILDPGSPMGPFEPPSEAPQKPTNGSWSSLWQTVKGWFSPTPNLSQPSNPQPFPQ